MRVSIVAPIANERTARQCRALTDGGHVCSVYVQEQTAGQESMGKSAAPEEFLESERASETPLFFFHYVGGAYPLLETMRQLRHGMVVLDLCDATVLESAPVHYADICLVADVAQKRALIEATGYVRERICVLPDRENYEETLRTTIDQALKGIVPQTAQVRAGAGAGGSETPLLIRDPALDQAAISNRVREAIRRRQAAGGYGPDVATLGPEALRPTPTGDEAVEDAHVFLLHLQTALDELAARSNLQEPEFHSRVPLVGFLIVGVRRLWNWMSTKWYVRGWMAQQADFNRYAVDVIRDLLRIQEITERRVHDLERELERLPREKDEDVAP